jgi:hypothetical protein
VLLSILVGPKVQLVNLKAATKQMNGTRGRYLTQGIFVPLCHLVKGRFRESSVHSNSHVGGED